MTDPRLAHAAELDRRLDEQDAFSEIAEEYGACPDCGSTEWEVWERDSENLVLDCPCGFRGRKFVGEVHG